jgi:hypothetical protein
MTVYEKGYGQLCWALERLAVAEESNDGHVSAEAKAQAKLPIEEIARQCENGDWS